jgi:hypothetical protein
VALTVAGHRFRAGWSSARRNSRSGDGHGWTMHRYGSSLLASLPQGALLVSHTDLDWNTVTS